MAKPRTIARCTECDRIEPRWVGRCPDCRSWGTMVEARVTPAASEAVPTDRGAPAAPASAPQRLATPIARIGLDDHRRRSTGIAELDRVLGGGFVPGSVTLVGGEPGAGKSTLLLQAAQSLARSGVTVLYVSAEESPGQVRLRADRLGALDERLLLAAETEIPQVLALVEHHRPALVIVDSIQTVRVPEVGAVAGGPAQVRESAAAIVAAAKRDGVAAVLVGHVTKDGQLAGPRVLEHLVDTVCELTGDRHHALRLLRATKNRFGAVGEVGCFEMRNDGMASVEDAGRLFVGETSADTTGVAVTLAMEGARAMACEVQALVVATPNPNPRRTASGLDAQRLALLVAVLAKRAAVDVAGDDVYVSTVGGLRLNEPGVDLALCLAIASSKRGEPVGRGTIVLGEVGLAGEVRLVARTQARLAEAARLGFVRALLPAAYDGPGYGLELLRAKDVPSALRRGLG